VLLAIRCSSNSCLEHRERLARRQLLEVPLFIVLQLCCTKTAHRGTAANHPHLHFYISTAHTLSSPPPGWAAPLSESPFANAPSRRRPSPPPLCSRPAETMETSTYNPTRFHPTYIPAYPPLSFSPARSEPADWLSVSKHSDKGLLGSSMGAEEQQQQPGTLQRRLKSRHSELQLLGGEKDSEEKQEQCS